MVGQFLLHIALSVHLLVLSIMGHQDYGPPLWPGGATSLQEYENAIAKMNSKKSPTQKKKEDLVVDEVTKDSQQNEGTSVLDSRDKNISNLKESLDNSVDRLESAIKTSSGMASSAANISGKTTNSSESIPLPSKLLKKSAQSKKKAQIKQSRSKDLLAFIVKDSSIGSARSSSGAGSSIHAMYPTPFNADDNSSAGSFFDAPINEFTWEEALCACMKKSLPPFLQGKLRAFEVAQKNLLAQM